MRFLIKRDSHFPPGGTRLMLTNGPHVFYHQLVLRFDPSQGYPPRLARRMPKSHDAACDMADAQFRTAISVSRRRRRPGAPTDSSRTRSRCSREQPNEAGPEHNDVERPQRTAHDSTLIILIRFAPITGRQRSSDARMTGLWH
jgi:hypothetical protein